MNYGLFERLESRQLLTAYLAEDLTTTPAFVVSGEASRIGEDSYFRLKTIENGLSLWKTDGTPDGTAVADDLAVSDRFFPSVFPIGDQIVRIVPEGLHESSLWGRSEEGFTKLATIGQVPSSPVEFDDGLVFVSVRDAEFEAIWTDGVEAKSLAAPSDRFYSVRVIDDRLFGLGNGLGELRNGAFELIEPDVFLGAAVAVGDGIIATNREQQLIAYNAPDFAPVPLADLTGRNLIPFRRGQFSATNALEHFLVQDIASTPDAAPTELWSTDGTKEGTQRMLKLPQAAQFVTDLVVHNGTTYLNSVSLSSQGSSTWRVNEGEKSLELVVESDHRISMNDYGDGKLLLFEFEDIRHTTRVYDIEDIDAGPWHELGPGEQILDIVDNRILQTRAVEEVYQLDLVSVDRESKQETILRSLNVPSDSTAPFSFISDGEVLHFRTGSFRSTGLARLSDTGVRQFDDPLPTTLSSGHVVGKQILYLADQPRLLSDNIPDRDRGISLWIGNGTEPPLEFAQIPRGNLTDIEVEVVGGNLFVEYDGEVWVTDGTANGTQLLSDIFPELQGDTVKLEDMVGTPDGLFFTRSNRGLYEVWQLDSNNRVTRLVEPSSIGLTRVREKLASTQFGHNPGYKRLFLSNGEVYFFQSGVQQNRLHRVTALGKESIGEIPGQSILVLETGHGAFFVTHNGPNQTLLGADLAAILDLGSEPIEVTNWQEVGDQLFISGTTFPSRTQYLWQTDGSKDGTKLVFRRELNGATINHGLAALDDMVFFASQTPDGTPELWGTDGTDRNTYVYKFDRTDPNSFDNHAPREFTRYQDKIVMSAGDRKHGRELWSLTSPKPIASDIDGNGRTNFEDFRLLAGQFGRKGDNLPADIDHDGDVDFQDFLLLAGEFGTKKEEVPTTAVAMIEPERVDLVIEDI